MTIRRKTERVYEVTPFGNFMRYLRRKNGENLVEMAEKLKIGRSYLTQVELGVKSSNVPLYLVKRIRNTYHMTPSELQELKLCIINASKNTRRMDFSNISDSDKQNILDYAYEVMFEMKADNNVN